MRSIVYPERQGGLYIWTEGEGDIYNFFSQFCIVASVQQFTYFTLKRGYVQQTYMGVIIQAKYNSTVRDGGYFVLVRSARNKKSEFCRNSKYSSKNKGKFQIFTFRKFILQICLCNITEFPKTQRSILYERQI